MALKKDASAIDLLDLIEQVPVLTTLFVDESELCQNYLKLNPWILDESEVFSVDEGMVDIFDVKKVPSYRLWIEGNEVLNLIGTCSHEVVLEHKEKYFGNLSFLSKTRKSEATALLSINSNSKTNSNSNPGETP